MNFAAHELLETSEALRTKAAQIEQHGALANQCQDQQLKNMLMKHQQLMVTGYQQGINLMQGKGAQITHQIPNFTNTTPNMTMHNQATMTAPMANTQSLSDQTIATLLLNAHKSGAVTGMMWANECVDPQLRMYHVNGANQCQEMAYELFTWMNLNGYYQPPTFNSAQTNQVTGMFQPMNTMDTPNMNQGSLQ